MSQEENRYQPRRAVPAHAQSRGEEPGQRPVKRRRRRRRMGALGALIYVAFVLGISALLAGLGWTWACDLLALNKQEHTAVITLPEEIFAQEERKVERTAADGTSETVTETISVADMDYVADLLSENGLIEYKFVFKTFASLTHAKYKLSSGTYELSTDMDYRALITSMGSSSGSRMVATVTIPEGMTQAQIFALLEAKGVSTADKLEETAANYDFKFSFLKGVLPLGDAKRLEGYLFPDTYEFYMGEDPVSVLNKMILRFDQIFTEEMRQAMTDQGMSINDAVIIASMIEKETDGSDQRRISSVIYNRLTNTSATNGLLNIDATILYATGGTVVDTSADTPYNTYRHAGLPPTAIANPGADALRAAVNPESTSYYYYALGDDGVHHFFKTHQEQLSFIATQERYRNG